MSETTFSITPIPADQVNVRRISKPNEFDEVVAAINGLETRAAKFVMDKTGDDLARAKRTFKRAANAIGKTARFGDDSPAVDGKGKVIPGSTTVTVKLTDKLAGRPRKETPAE